MTEHLKTITDIWPLVKDVWNNGFLGVDIGQIVIALLIFMGFLIIRGIFSRYIIERLHKWTEKTKTDIDNKIIEAIKPPLKFIPIILGAYFSLQYAGLDEQLGDGFHRIIKSMIAFTLFWALFRSIHPLSNSIKSLNDLLTPIMVQWIFKIMKSLTVFIGAAIILEIWGIQVGPMLAGLGLFGAAVALGAQDLFKNLIGGMTIIAEHRFLNGDWIKVDGVVEGVVEDIGLRSTRIRRFDKAPVHVPNAQLSDAAVINFSRMTNRRIYWKLGLTYSSSIDQLQIVRDGITTYLYESKEFETSSKVTTLVHIDSFNDSSIDLMVYCFTKTTDWKKWLEIKEGFAFFIKDLVEEKAGTSFAFPSQSIYLETLPADRPEVFVPPQKKTAKAKK
ncbi:MAG: mechanosensitive ion channel family protein [Alphaproteobacteria bacterium]|nr:mechanosensitive ion channel family protein [Alphaproteobacteria bacterium]